MTEVIYSIGLPYSEGTIEVYGEPEEGWYEWRIIENGKTLYDTGRVTRYGMQYGSPGIALRDALNHAEPPPGEPALLTPISWLPGRDAVTENIAQAHRVADTVRGMATELANDAANAKTDRGFMNPDHPNGRLGMIYTDSRTKHAERIIQVLNRAADALHDIARLDAQK